MFHECRKIRNLIASVEEACERFSRFRIDGEIASERTFRMQVEVMKRFCRTLHEEKYELEVADNIGEKHINAVFDSWVLKDDLSPKTLQNQKSRVRIFFASLGKQQLAKHVAEIESRYPDKYPMGFRVKTVAETSKSWRGAEIDVDMLIVQARELDLRFAAMLGLARNFGLRKKECLLINPWKADKGNVLVLDGNITKNGRYREVSFRDGVYGQNQRAALDDAKRQCKRNEYLGWPGLTLKQCERRYYHYTRQLGLTKEDIGMTGHGLRAGHAEDVMLMSGVLPATLGGTKSMTSAFRRKAVKYDTSKTLGHNREVITGAYVGSDTHRLKPNVALGYKLGDAFARACINETVQLWISERPRESHQHPGMLELSEVQMQTAMITAQITDDGEEVERLTLKQLLKLDKSVFAQVEERLELVGFSLIGDDDD